ncbi:MAG: alanine racemase [Lachnospiraceae bacterium]|nr:alanine racemase [Lachnospiraceae bacterium]
MKLSFSDLVSCTGGKTTYCGEDFSVRDLKFDSRENVENSAFFALITDKDDGHKYVSVAAGKGAVAAVVSKDIDTSVPTILVEDTWKAYQDVAAFYRSQFHMPIIAITGSNGKTTVKDMLFSVLSTKYKVLATEKNYNSKLGVPQTLLKIDHSYDAVVVEMGMSHSGEIRTLSNIVKPDAAIVTKIGMAHIGNFSGDRIDIFNAKMEIIDGLKENGMLVLCSDDDMLQGVTSDSHEIVFCGMKNDNNNFLHASDIVQFWDDDNYGLKFLVHYNENCYECILPTLGRHNVQNALLALTAGIRFGVNIEEAIEALRVYPRSPMRLENVVLCGRKFIKDYYNASPDSTKSAIDTLAEIQCGGTRILVLGDLSELGEKSIEVHREIAEYTIGKVDTVYYVGEYCDAVLSGRPDARCFETKDELNFALSSAILKDEVKYGDIILIKGSNSVRMWEQYEFIRKLLEQGTVVSAQTRLLVDVDALKYNYITIKNYVGNEVQVMPVLKADAYSTGAALLANVYNDCNFFAVADLSEAEELHAVMPNARFLILYQPFLQDVDWIVEHDYIVTSVSDTAFVRELNKAAVKADKKVTIHIEVDTGMGRLGVLIKDCEEFSKVVKECSNLLVEGVFTHYSSADMYTTEDLEYTAKQTEDFKKAISIVESILGPIKLKHACAGAAIFNPEAELFNMVRPGYILRGYYPCEEIREKIDLRPVLKYVTQVTEIKEFETGASISYGRHYVTKRKTRLAEVPVGYSDGLMRNLSNKGAFVINGQLAPIVGNITMDYTMVDVTDINPMVWVGDEVAIFDNINMTIERMAELCNTIGYEIITNIKDKADRIECF